MTRGWWRGFCVISAPGMPRLPGCPLQTLQGSKPANRVRTQTSCSTTKMCSPIESRPLASRLGAWPVAAGFSRVGQRRARVAAAQFPPIPPRQTSHHTPNDLPLGQTRQETGGNWRLPSSQAVRNMVASENQFSLARAAPNAGGRARIKFFSAGPRPNPSTDLLASDRQD
jgi:hypothetical protein